MLNNDSVSRKDAKEQSRKVRVSLLSGFAPYVALRETKSLFFYPDTVSFKNRGFDVFLFIISQTLVSAGFL